VDRLSPSRRSWLMSRVKSKDTGPEMRVRRAVHGLGYRFRLHQRKLSGCPDLVLPRLRSVIFVHGCFWHRHRGCPKASMPRSHKDYWLDKFVRNAARDRKAKAELKSLGWRVLVVWECQTKDASKLQARLRRYLSSASVVQPSKRHAGGSPGRFLRIPKSLSRAQIR
jgi:DNA mismatch endonuclease, patch repair protein